MPQRLFHRLQRVGKALMVPVAVLPVAGLLVGLGNAVPFFPELLTNLLLYTGASVFELLPLMFAVAVALTFCHQDGTAALAAVTGYGALLATMAALAQSFGWPTQPVLGFQTLNTGVLGGVLIGLQTSAAYRRFHKIRLPEAFAFFSERRLVPLVNVPLGMLLGAVLAMLWPALQSLLDRFSDWALFQQPMLAWGLYGTVERLLIPLGLHHIWNLPFFYEIGQYNAGPNYPVTGEITRFLAGDPNAGHLAGGYLVKLWGLPAAALAIWHCAEPRQRRQTGGIMISAALTCWLTGVTEPIEFAFLFIAPGLFLLHALLTGLAYMLAIYVGAHHGIVFSHGMLDFLLYLQISRDPWPLLWLGLPVALLYYTLFRVAILRFDLATPGRTRHRQSRFFKASTEAILAALGGAENLKSLDACLTRLRLSLYQPERLDPAALKRLGAKAVIQHGEGVQLVVGTQADGVRARLQQALKPRSD
ncbi:PTS transporter subunit EIIC [Ferrimonas marina]|uniref:PTS system, glucose-specific IIC component n=1 Tax=Ferrimonas marina TaxID=299255 RepID=A0A1M5YG27_9GAMM|nr:PTS transporter subunit EIIC [Ferrimonas marina]SHI10844.1 PTS system, glucose-specific IIC component [Ferrimonas marina]